MDALVRSRILKKLNKYNEQRPFTAPFSGPSAVINVLDVDDDQVTRLRGRVAT